MPVILAESCGGFGHCRGQGRYHGGLLDCEFNARTEVHEGQRADRMATLMSLRTVTAEMEMVTPLFATSHAVIVSSMLPPS
jgi:hypothetical protein